MPLGTEVGLGPDDIVYDDKLGVVHTNIESQRSDANCTTYLR